MRGGGDSVPCKDAPVRADHMPVRGLSGELILVLVEVEVEDDSEADGESCVL